MYPHGDMYISKAHINSLLIIRRGGHVVPETVFPAGRRWLAVSLLLGNVQFAAWTPIAVDKQKGVIIRSCRDIEGQYRHTHTRPYSACRRTIISRHCCSHKSVRNVLLYIWWPCVARTNHHHFLFHRFYFISLFSFRPLGFITWPNFIFTGRIETIWGGLICRAKPTNRSFVSWPRPYIYIYWGEFRGKTFYIPRECRCELYQAVKLARALVL